MNARLLGRLVLATTLPLLALSACAPGTSAPVAGSPAALADGSREIRVQPRLAAGYGLQNASAAVAFTPAVVSHIRLAIFTVDTNNVETAVMTGAGAAVTLDLKPVQFGGTITFGHLRDGLHYRIRATAYKTVNSVDSVISTSDSGSYVDVVVPANAQQTFNVPLTVHLANQAKSARLLGTPAAVDAVAATAQGRGGAAIAYNGDTNQYLVVWRDTPTGNPSTGEIDAQRLAADGSQVGSAFLVSTKPGARYQSQPTVAYNTVAKEFLVAWADGTNFAQDSGPNVGGFNDMNSPESVIGVRRIAGISSPGSDLLGSQVSVGAAGGLEVAPYYHYDSPVLAYNSAGGGQYQLLYHLNLPDCCGGANREYVSLQPLTSAGAPSGAAVQLGTGSNNATPPTYVQVVGGMAGNGSFGHYLVPFAKDNVDANYLDHYTINLHQYTANGTAAGPANSIALVAGAFAANMGCASNPSTGDFLLAWADDDGTTYPPPPGAVYAQLVGDATSATPGLKGSKVQVSDASSTAQSDVAAVYNPLYNEYMVVWSDSSTTNTLKGERLNAAGQPIDLTNGAKSNFVVASSPQSLGNPSFAYNATTNQAFGVWATRSLNSSPSDIYGQIVDYFYATTP